LGTRPIRAARLRPDENTFQSPTSATRGGGDDRTDARDFLKPTALFTRSMPGVDALPDGFIRRRFGENPSLATSI
jgi:hypothetical protein